jgi:hypothetical protein
MLNNDLNATTAGEYAQSPRKFEDCAELSAPAFHIQRSLAIRGETWSFGKAARSAVKALEQIEERKHSSEQQN